MYLYPCFWKNQDDLQTQLIEKRACDGCSRESGKRIYLFNEAMETPTLSNPRDVWIEDTSSQQNKGTKIWDFTTMESRYRNFFTTRCAELWRSIIVRLKLETDSNQRRSNGEEGDVRPICGISGGGDRRVVLRIFCTLWCSIIPCTHPE